MPPNCLLIESYTEASFFCCKDNGFRTIDVLFEFFYGRYSKCPSGMVVWRASEGTYVSCGVTCYPLPCSNAYKGYWFFPQKAKRCVRTQLLIPDIWHSNFFLPKYLCFSLFVKDNILTLHPKVTHKMCDSTAKVGYKMCDFDWKLGIKTCKDMYIRKIELTFQSWFDSPSHKPIVVKGVRQCGKTSCSHCRCIWHSCWMRCKT